jgi:hypothetical protein
MGDEKISLELVGTRLLVLTAEVRDLEQRFGILEARLSGIEARLGGIAAAIDSRFAAVDARLDMIDRRLAAQEERQGRILAPVVRIAERLDGGATP